MAHEFDVSKLDLETEFEIPENSFIVNAMLIAEVKNFATDQTFVAFATTPGMSMVTQIGLVRIGQQLLEAGMLAEAEEFEGDD